MHWNRNEWAKTFQGDHKLILMEERGRTAMFASQHWRMINHNLFADSPIFSVWDGDEMIYCGESRQEAYKIFKRIQASE